MLDIPVTDDKLGPVGTVASLAPGASQTLYKYGTATGTVTGKTPRNVAVSAFDPSGDFCAKPSLSINRLTNGEDGATIPAGTPLTWTDQVTNTGNVTRASIVVMDDNGTPLDTSDDITVGTINSLDPGKSLALGDFGFALLGSYSNLGTASSSYTDGLGNTKRVSATDPSSYIGQRVNRESATLGFYPSSVQLLPPLVEFSMRNPLSLPALSCHDRSSPSSAGF